MKRWIQRILAGALCLALAGCGGPRLEEYPRVEPEKKETAPQALTIDLPRDSDQLTVDAVNQLSAAVLELSGGAVTLSPIFSDRPAIALREGSTHMALLTNRDILEAEPALSFIDWPFFWDSPEQYLTVMGAEEGLVRGSGDLAAALGGQVAGVWYGGRVSLLCRAAFYEEVAFAGSAFGGLEGRGGTGYFTDIGEDLQARETLEREPEELLLLLDQREVKYLEYPLLSLDAEGLPQSLKYLEDTAHRVQGHWLAISDQVEPETAALLQAAAAYVPQSALTARLQAEEAMLAELEAQQAAKKAKAEPEVKAEPVAPQITVDDFFKVDLRVCRVVKCEAVPKAKKLLRLELDDGMGGRQIVSSIHPWYEPEDLTGHNIIVIVNLKPAKFCGVESNGMLLAGDDADGNCKVVFADQLPAGTKIG